MLLYAMAVLVALLTGVLAWAISEARLAFASLGAACVGGLCWAAQRFPEMRGVHFRIAALLTLVASISVAVLFPSTRVLADCPMPRDAAPGFSCGGTNDRHMTIRLVIFAVGAVATLALMALASRRDSGDRSPHAAAAV